MTEQRLLRLIPALPAGTNEIYFHPAASGPESSALMVPGYEYQNELSTLLSPAVRAALDQHERTTYGKLAS